MSSINCPNPQLGNAAAVDEGGRRTRLGSNSRVWILDVTGNVVPGQILKREPKNPRS